MASPLVTGCHHNTIVQLDMTIVTLNMLWLTAMQVGICIHQHAPRTACKAGMPYVVDSIDAVTFRRVASKPG